MQFTIIEKPIIVIHHFKAEKQSLQFSQLLNEIHCITDDVVHRKHSLHYTTCSLFYELLSY